MEYNSSLIIETANGLDILNSTGFVIRPYIVDGIYYNYHFLIIEQFLAAILIILCFFFGLYTYRWLTREVFTK